MRSDLIIVVVLLLGVSGVGHALEVEIGAERYLLGQPIPLQWSGRASLEEFGCELVEQTRGAVAFLPSERDHDPRLGRRGPRRARRAR